MASVVKSEPRRKRAGSAASKTAKVANSARNAAPGRKLPVKERPAQVLRRFRVVFNAIKTHFRQIEKGAGIGGAQLWALGIVRDHPDIGMTDLARSMDVHQSTASNLVKSLVERELIAVLKDGADRRTVALRILPLGRKVLRSVPGPFSGVLPDALASLDARTLSRLDEDLGRLIAVLGADERAAGIPLGDL
jgi:DNA-binding MarR family transcriptional regulator